MNLLEIIEQTVCWPDA